MKNETELKKLMEFKSSIDGLIKAYENETSNMTNLGHLALLRDVINDLKSHLLPVGSISTDDAWDPHDPLLVPAYDPDGAEPEFWKQVGKCHRNTAQLLRANGNNTKPLYEDLELMGNLLKRGMDVYTLKHLGSESCEG